MGRKEGINIAASASDKFKKLSRRWVGQIGSGGIADNSTTTIPLSSTTNLATDTAVVVVIDRVNANGVATPALEETVIGVVSGSNLINCIRGAEGTAQAHNAGAVVEVLFSAKGWNDLVDGLLVSHNQDGSIVSGIALSSPVLNGDLTGDAILDEDDMASDSATKVPSQQSVKAYVDEQLEGAGSTDGWTADPDTWVYVSATSFKVTGKDVTARFTKGTRIKLTQTSAKYFVVSSSSFSTDTTVNITAGTDYTLANAAITNPFYSYQANPQGYPSTFNYTPTYTGFSVAPTIAHRFSVIGGVCTIHRDSNVGTADGTSSGTGFTFTLPIASRNIHYGHPVFGKDNGTNLTTPANLTLGAGSNMVTAFKTFYNGAWTSSGAKSLFFASFSYEI